MKKNSKTIPPKTKKISLEQKFSLIAGIIAVVFFSLMAISSIFLQKNLREESQDTRKDASYVDIMPSIKKSFITFSIPTPSLASHEKKTIEFFLNTQGVEASGVQLSFAIFGKLDVSPVFSIKNQEGLPSLQIVAQKITAESDSSRFVDILIIPTDPGKPFALSSATPILTVDLTPADEKYITFSFDNNKSFVTRYISAENLLTPVQPTVFYIDEESNSNCPKPTNFEVSSLSCSTDQKVTAVLKWDAIAGVSQYELQFSRNANFSPLSSEISTLTNQATYNFTNQSDGDWYIRVRAHESTSCLTNDDGWQTVFFSKECTENSLCEYGFGSWSACTNGWQTRTYTAKPSTCEAPPESSLKRACSTQCQYEYSNWSACTNGWQTRTYSVTPNNCYWYETSTLEELNRRCEEQNSDHYLHLYNYESCWYGNSSGNSTYIYWDNAKFANASWIDISPYSDFREFANKNVSGLNEKYYQYLITTGAGFKWNKSGQPNFNFEPNKTYFIRLYNGTHSQVETFYMPQCSGMGGVTYKQCNESCTSNKDCAPNLSCYNNACRLVTNTSSSVCAPPPDKGLNRSCNEYCADKNECASGYTCSWNRCRNPLNLGNTECENPSSASNTTYKTLASLPQYETDVTKYCNAYCNYNRDCGANFRCVSNQCRLAINPNSPTCSTAISNEKGADGDQENVKEETEKKESSTNSAVTTDTEINSEKDAVQNEMKEDEDFINQTALDALRDYLKSKGYSFQQLGLMMLGVVLAIILLSFLKKALTKPQVYKPTSQNVASSAGQTDNQVNAFTKSIQTSPKEMPQISNLEHPVYPQDIPPTNSAAQNLSTKNPMMDRIKSKGIKIPK